MGQIREEEGQGDMLLLKEEEGKNKGDSFTLIYWNMKGAAEPIRILFAMIGREYQDKRVSPEEWEEMQEKYGGRQLPILDINNGEKILSYPNTIMRYLWTHKFGLDELNKFENALVDEMGEALNDLRVEWRRYLSLPDSNPDKEDIKNVTTPLALDFFESTKLNNQGKFLFGSKISWVDITCASFFHLIEQVTGENLLDPDYPGLAELKNEVENIPGIKGWIEERPETKF